MHPGVRASTELRPHPEDSAKSGFLAEGVEQTPGWDALQTLAAGQQELGAEERAGWGGGRQVPIAEQMGSGGLPACRIALWPPLGLDSCSEG